MNLDIELEDRTLNVDVPPLEAAFIELFSQKGAPHAILGCCRTKPPCLDVWTLDELIHSVGDVHRSAAVKALTTWVNLGVLKEQTENSFVLLERAEAGVEMKDIQPSESYLPPLEWRESDLISCLQRPRLLLTFPPCKRSNSSKRSRCGYIGRYAYSSLSGWAAAFFEPLLMISALAYCATVHRRHAHEPRNASPRPNTNNAQVRAWLRPKYRAAWLVYGGCEKRRFGAPCERAVEVEQVKWWWDEKARCLCVRCSVQ